MPKNILKVLKIAKILFKKNFLVLPFCVILAKVAKDRCAVFLFTHRNGRIEMQHIYHLH